MNIEINHQEAVLIVTALGVYQNRLGQKASWEQRKRQHTLRHRLADSIIVGDEQEAAGVRKAIDASKKRVSRCMAIGEEANHLRITIKEAAGVTNEHQGVGRL